MDVLMRDAEYIPCPHCRHQFRRGMIRCRECGGVVNDDFVLSPAAALAPRSCGRCGTAIDPSVGECLNCASAMLDQLLNSVPDPVELPARAPVAPAASSESRLRDYTPRPSPARPTPPGPARKQRSTVRETARVTEAQIDAATSPLFESETNVPDQRSRLTVIAERRVAARSAPAMRAAGYSQARAYGKPANRGTLVKPLLVVVGLALVGGGIWWWQTRPPGTFVSSKAREDPYAYLKVKVPPKPTITVVAPGTDTSPNAFGNEP